MVGIGYSHFWRFRLQRFWKRSVSIPVTDEIRAKRNLPRDADKIHSREPWPEAQARLAEIISAWDKYRDDIAAAHERSGYADATEERVEAVRAPLMSRTELHVHAPRRCRA
jgi:hypothetical protein